MTNKSGKTETVKRRRKVEKSKARYKLPPPPEPMKEIARTPPALACEVAIDGANKHLLQECASKQFVIESGRPCAKGAGAIGPVDLIVVIDTSGSMADEAKKLSAAADAAIQAAAKSCPSDLRVCWFGIEGTWVTQDPNTRFTQSYRSYLQGGMTSKQGDCHYSLPPVPDPDIVGTPNDYEDGAAAIMDQSDHFDWRPGAARAIFYLGDEALEGGNPQAADDVTAANSAIAVAKARGVTVFTYAGTGITPATAAEYARVASETGGQSFTAPVSNLGGFQIVLEHIICASASAGCGPVQVPDIRPCFELHWGDSPKDIIETEDIEVLCITACNPYSNVTFKDLTVVLSVVTDSDGKLVPTLPDGTPSVVIKPANFICFGNLPPCDANKPEAISCLSREIVLISHGAKAGDYLVKIGYCYSTEFTLNGMDEFKIELIKS